VGRYADALLEASVALRRELLVFERELRRTRKRVMKGQLDVDPSTIPDLIAVRVNVNGRFEELERCRRRWRAVYFRLEAEAGKSFGEIARQWGLSRQLVSRLMNDEWGRDECAGVSESASSTSV
jgi:hypothetical protein